MHSSTRVFLLFPIFEKVFEPVFKGKDISLEITLLEFYEYTQIEHHFFATQINGKTSFDVDFSYLTHPHWRLLDCVYASCCIPCFFEPFLHENHCYIDGAFFINYPLQPCIERVGLENSHSVLGIKQVVVEDDLDQAITQDSTMMDVIWNIKDRLVERYMAEHTKQGKELEIPLFRNKDNLRTFFGAIESESARIALFQNGIDCFKKCVNSLPHPSS